jgi:hypothetical protein
VVELQKIPPKIQRERLYVGCHRQAFGQSRRRHITVLQGHLKFRAALNMCAM